MDAEKQAFVELCRELRALGATSVEDGKHRASFSERTPLNSVPAAPKAGKGPMRQPSPDEVKAELERRRSKELSRV